MSVGAFWAADALVHEGLDVYVSRQPGQYDDGGTSLVVNGLMVRVRDSDLAFATPMGYRWDTVAFDTAKGFREEKHPQAYMVASSGSNGFVVIPQSHYKVVEFHRRKRGDGFVSMAELDRRHCWSLEQFYVWVLNRTQESYDPEALMARIDEGAWRHVYVQSQPELLPLTAKSSVIHTDDPRAQEGNCIRCGRRKPPGNPAYCYACHKLSRAYTAEESVGKPGADIVADYRDAFRSRMGRYVAQESDAALLAYVYKVLDEERGIKRSRTKRADGRFKDVAYEDEQELDL